MKAREALVAIWMAAAVTTTPAVGAEPERAARRVAVLVFEGVQLIDFTGPYEFFETAPGFEVFTVAERPEPLTTAAGLRIVPDHTFANHPKPDVLLIPGGRVDEQLGRERVVGWIREKAREAEVVLSVCNGAFLLAKAGLLDGLEATTTSFLIERLRLVAPKAKVVSDKRVVDNGKVLTAGGLTAGIDASLLVIEKLRGKGVAQRVALAQEYNWDREGSWVRAALADRFLPDRLHGFEPGSPRLGSTQGDRDHWSTRWVLTSARPLAEVVRRVEANLSGPLAGAAVEWRKQSETASSSEATSSWAFADERGGLWKGHVKVERRGEGPEGYSISLSVERSGEAAPAHLRSDPSEEDPRLSVGGSRIGIEIPTDLDLSATRRSESGRFEVSIQPEGGAIKPGEAQAWTVDVRWADGRPVEEATIRVGGGMPQHGHGLSTRPRATRYLGNGRYRVEGLLLGSMRRGRAWWELRFLVRAGSTEDLAIFHVLLPPQESR